MKRRIPTTITLLAVAITASTGCSRASAPSPNTQVTAEAPPPAPTATALEPPAPSAQALVAPSRPEVDNRELHPLRDELLGAKPSQVIAGAAHFRPLCDNDGYPLVGNVAPGKSMHQVTQPSAFCATVRKEAMR